MRAAWPSLADVAIRAAIGAAHARAACREPIPSQSMSPESGSGFGLSAGRALISFNISFDIRYGFEIIKMKFDIACIFATRNSSGLAIGMALVRRWAILSRVEAGAVAGVGGTVQAALR